MRKNIGVLVACCALAAVSLGVSVNADGVFYTSVCALTGAGRGAVAVYAMLASLATGFCSPAVVRLMRRYPVRLLAGAGVIMMTAASLLMGLAKSLPVYYALGLLRGVGMAFTSLTMVSVVICDWFVERRGLALGLAMSFSGIAGAVCSPIFNWAIGELGYFGARALSAGLTLAALPAALMLKLNPAQRLVSEIAGGKTAPQLKYFSVLFILLAVFASCANPITSIAGQLPGFSESIDLGAATGAAMVSFCMIGNIASKLLIGVLSDRLGIARALVIMLAATASALAAFIIAPPKAGALLPAALMLGAIFSVGSVGNSMLVRAVYGAEGYGRAYALIALISGVFTAFSQSLVGFVYDFTGGYAAVFGAALALIGACAALLMYFKFSGAIRES